MPVVVGISLRTAGKLYFFNAEQERYYIGERLVVETTRGQEIGIVKIPPHEVSEAEIVPPLKDILRRATTMDVSRDQLNREREERALLACKRLVDQLHLPMRLIDAQFSLDSTHVLIHFLADNRVDFRELVRDLAHELHARIELRQVGVRDEAKLIGGYGICGRQLCCSAFLDDFTPVAISMAKDQGLALNPQKISGSCGRLMCCLAFECDQYREDRADLPRVNSLVNTPQGPGKVVKLNVLSRMVEVIIQENAALVWFNVDDLAGAPARRGCCAGHAADAPAGSCPGCGKNPNDSESLIQLQDSRPVESTRTGSEATLTTVAGKQQDVPTPGAGDGKSARKRRRGGRGKTSSGQAAPSPASPAQPHSPADVNTAAQRSRPRHPRQQAGEQKQPPPALPAGGVPPQTRPPGGRFRPRRRKNSGPNQGT